MASIHDSEIISYEVNLKKKEISIQTFSELGQNLTINFTEVLAHFFETQLSGSIIFDIEEKEPGELFVNNRDLLEKQKNYCWPIDYTDLKELEEYLGKHHYSYFVISASYGLNGWVVAKKYEIISSN